MRRRKFIQNAMWASTLPLMINACPKPKVHKNEKTLGVALLGLGSYSLGQLAPALQLTKHCSLAGLITGTPSKLPALQQALQANYLPCNNNMEFLIVMCIPMNLWMISPTTMI